MSGHTFLVTFGLPLTELNIGKLKYVTDKDKDQICLARLPAGLLYLPPFQHLKNATIFSLSFPM